MRRIPLLGDRALGTARAVGAALVCVTGLVLLGRVLNEHYPIRDWLIWRLLRLAGYTLIFNAACVSGGAGALGLLFRKRELPALEWLVLSMCLGLTGFVVCLFAAGALCLLNPVTAVVLPALFLAAGHRAVPRLFASFEGFGGLPATTPGRVAAYLSTGFGAVCLAFMYLEALDLSAINFDANWYHLPIAQEYARLGCLVRFTGDNHRAFPHLTSMVHTWALLVPGLKPLELHWMLSLHLEYSIVVWRIVAVAAGIRWMLHGQNVRGLWAVFFLFPVIFIYDQNIGGSADHFLGVFSMPMVLVAARALRAFDWRWSVVLGVLTGGYLLTKYQAVFLLVALTLFYVARWGYYVFCTWRAKRPSEARRRQRFTRLMLAPALAVGVAAVVSAPHFVKNAIYHGNPVYPQATSIFKGSHPVRAPGPYQHPKPKGAFYPKEEGLARQAWALRLLYDYSFSTRNRNLTEYRPYLGSLFSLLLPCLLFVRRRGRVAFTAGIGSVAFLVWANLVPNDRYLLSFLDLFIASAGALMVGVWQLGWLARGALMPLVALQLFWGGDAMLFYGRKRLTAALDMIADGYAGKSIQQRVSHQTNQQNITAATPPDARILGRNYKSLVGLNRDVVSDSSVQEDISYSNLRDPHELWQLLKEKGITHLLYPNGERTPEKVNNAVLFDALFRHAEDVKRFGNVFVGKLPETPPPPSAPYHVLTIGLPAYPDGLYRVEQLDVDDRFYAVTKPKPKPIRRFSQAKAERLLDDAQAVVVGVRKSAGTLGSALTRDFERFEAFKKYSVYLRRR
jgi:hypothetical protein